MSDEKERQARMRFKGQSVWVNTETGETRTVDEFERPVGRTEPFMITYLSEIISLIETLGNQKMKVVKYILKSMDKSSNTLIMTVREISKGSGVGYNTCIETLKLLEDANIIKRRSGSLMLKPKLLNNRRASGEATMMVKYNNFESEEEN